MERVYEEAFTEVDEILKIMPIDLLSKIPVKFRKIISENKAQDYKVDAQILLNEDKLKEETIVILGLIYRDFLASSEEREDLQLRDAEELRRIEEEMQQKYDMGNIFQRRRKKNKSQDEDFSTDLVLYKEQGVIKKLFNLIKGLFNKNKF